jgi:hypothetical protein
MPITDQLLDLIFSADGMSAEQTLVLGRDDGFYAISANSAHQIKMTISRRTRRQATGHLHSSLQSRKPLLCSCQRSAYLFG